MFNNSKGVDVINKVKEFNKKNDIRVDTEQAEEAFANDKALFMIGQPRFARQVEALANMKSDFGIVPLPKGAVFHQIRRFGGSRRADYDGTGDGEKRSG